jgi:hypothetical protein
MVDQLHNLYLSLLRGQTPSDAGFAHAAT